MADSLMVLSGPDGVSLPHAMTWREYVSWCIRTGRIVGPAQKTEAATPEPIRARAGEASQETGVLPLGEWGGACHRGFVSDSRFGSGQVIKRTNRSTTRKWRNSQGGRP